MNHIITQKEFVPEDNVGVAVGYEVPPGWNRNERSPTVSS
jgi:hypothetical protein